MNDLGCMVLGGKANWLGLDSCSASSSVEVSVLRFWCVCVCFEHSFVRFLLEVSL